MAEEIVLAGVPSNEEVSYMLSAISSELARVAKESEYFDVSEEAVAALTYEQAKDLHKQANELISAVEEAKKAFGRSWDAPKKAVYDKCKADTEVLNRAKQAFASQRDAKDAEYRAAKLAMLEAEFAQFMADNGLSEIAGLVSIEKAAQPLLSRSTSEKKAVAGILEFASEVIKGYNLLANSDLFERDKVMSAYFDGFDAVSLLEIDRRRREAAKAREEEEARRADAMARLEEQRKEAEAYVEPSVSDQEETHTKAEEECGTYAMVFSMKPSMLPFFMEGCANFGLTKDTCSFYDCGKKNKDEVKVI